jgi:hypothetical protein
MTEDPTEGCLLCGATWGSYLGEVQGRTERFCCDACARFYVLALKEAQRQTGWERVDRLFLEKVRGNQGEGWVRHGSERRRIRVEGVPDGSRLTSLRFLDP